MSKYESSIKQINAPQETVYNALSNLSNLEKVKDRIPEDKISNFSFTEDEVSVTADPVGKVTFRIVEREPAKCIKFEAVESPLPLKMWIQLLPTGEATSKMRITVDADVPIFLKAMVSKPLQEGVEKIADAISMIPF